MVSEIEAALRADGVELDGTELHQAIAIAQQRCELKTRPAGALGEPLATAPRGEAALRRLWLAVAGDFP